MPRGQGPSLPSARPQLDDASPPPQSPARGQGRPAERKSPRTASEGIRRSRRFASGDRSLGRGTGRETPSAGKRRGSCAASHGSARRGCAARSPSPPLHSRRPRARSDPARSVRRDRTRAPSSAFAHQLNLRRDLNFVPHEDIDGIEDLIPRHPKSLRYSTPSAVKPRRRLPDGSLISPSNVTSRVTGCVTPRIVSSP